MRSCTRSSWLALFICASWFVPAASQPPSTAGYSAADLRRMSADELESLYRQAPPVSGLDGAFAGESLGRFSRAAGLVWKGKQFHAEQGVMVNRWAFGLEAVPARVEVGPSLLDGQPALVLDYRGSSKLVWRNVRDELREIAPGVYLGRMYEIRGCHAKFVRSFVLHACPCR